jgi:hypothetical protein
MGAVADTASEKADKVKSQVKAKVEIIMPEIMPEHSLNGCKHIKRGDISNYLELVEKEF